MLPGSRPTFSRFQITGEEGAGAGKDTGLGRSQGFVLGIWTMV